MISPLIFVFGSNTAGRHGKGAALEAKQKYGAVYGVGEGPTGQCYALPTKKEVENRRLVTRSLKAIAKSLKRFLKYARSHPQQIFLVTPIGCGLAGYQKKQIAQLFLDQSPLPENIVFSRDWFQEYAEK